ncbi:hypothetical protein [Thalassobellus sediminis]|uniref:hypothetical protein n=1 Tax=Thalassobellus sediminis TaxID=3367753 RepID=UPI0037966BE5
MKFIILIVFFFSTFCFSQKQYVFDYLIEYDLVKSNDFIGNLSKIYYLTNSKDNSYNAFLTELDSLSFKLNLIEPNGVYSNVKVLKSDFYKAEFINIDCSNITKSVDVISKKDKKYFETVLLKDTIIEKQVYKRYKINYTNRKRNKKKKYNSLFYIIENNTTFHLPIKTHTVLLDTENLNIDLPYGIYKERYSYDYLENFIFKHKLNNYNMIDVKLFVPDNCK